MRQRRSLGLVGAGLLALTLIWWLTDVLSAYDTEIERPAPSDEKAWATWFATATRHQGICYAWTYGGADIVSSGSSFGVGREITQGSGCARIVELHVRVSCHTGGRPGRRARLVCQASIGVQVLGELPREARTALRKRLESRYRLTESVLLDDPVGAAGVAVRALPVVVAEQGLGPEIPGAAERIGAGRVTGRDGPWWPVNSGVAAVLMAAWLGYGVWLLGIWVWRQRRAYAAETERLITQWEAQDPTRSDGTERREERAPNPGRRAERQRGMRREWSRRRRNRRR